MKAYLCKCPGCDFEGDRIVNGNEVLKCKCGDVLEKKGGPIGGSNILPLQSNEQDRFVSFKSETLSRLISSESEMKKAHEDMYGIAAVEFSTLSFSSTADDDEDDEDEEDEKEEPQKPQRGRPRKPVVEDDEDEDGA